MLCLLCSLRLMPAVLTLLHFARGAAPALCAQRQCSHTFAAAAALKPTGAPARRQASTATSSMPQPIVIPPKAQHSGSVIMLHGLGDSGAGWADIAQLFSGSLPHVKVTERFCVKRSSHHGTHGQMWRCTSCLSFRSSSFQALLRGLSHSMAACGCQAGEHCCLVATTYCSSEYSHAPTSSLLVRIRRCICAGST